MASPDGLRETLLATLRQRYGCVTKLKASQSLYDVGDPPVRIYTRYSRLHRAKRTFYGLRNEDLRLLEGRPAFICFLWEHQTQPLFVPFADYEDVFQSVAPARDGQYKTQILLGSEGNELYVARAGRFNVDAHFGWEAVENAIRRRPDAVPSLSHGQVQTLIGAIGVLKHFDVWIPAQDRGRLDWTIADRFQSLSRLPFDRDARALLQEVDTIWFHRGSRSPVAFYEVEHSTPVYSGLLRLNDIRLALPSVSRFAIVSNETRRSIFARQLHRPTFERSGLSELCTFFEYADVFTWHHRLRGHQSKAKRVDID